MVGGGWLVAGGGGGWLWEPGPPRPCSGRAASLRVRPGRGEVATSGCFAALAADHRVVGRPGLHLVFLFSQTRSPTPSTHPPTNHTTCAHPPSDTLSLHLTQPPSTPTSPLTNPPTHQGRTCSKTLNSFKRGLWAGKIIVFRDFRCNIFVRYLCQVMQSSCVYSLQACFACC